MKRLQRKRTAAKQHKSSLSVLAIIIGLLILSVYPGPRDPKAQEPQAVSAGKNTEQTLINTPVTELTPELQQLVEELRTFWKREKRSQITKLAFQPFTVPARKSEIEYFPCMECHEEQETNPSERQLAEEHEDIVLDHGKNRFWCLTCHNEQNRDVLISLKKQEIDYNASYLLCGQCHFQRQEDWLMGGHGKRIGNWYGERIILLCIECHDPHSPSIKPKLPDPKPKDLRTGRRPDEAGHLSQKTDHYRLIKVWEQIKMKHDKERAQ